MSAEPRRIIAVLGAGSMAGALVRRLAATKDVHFRLTTGTSRPDWLTQLSSADHVALADNPLANQQAVQGAQVVLLGVKPAGIVPLLTEIADALEPGALVVSVAGGVTLGHMSAAVPAGTALVRAMPNTPVEVGLGVTAFAVATGAPAGTRARFEELFAPSGEVELLDEVLIDGFSAVIGSGPAYVYAVVEALQVAAVEQGLTPEQAARMVPAMMTGALEYLASSGQDPAHLRAQVTSPGGSTAAALAVFDSQGMADALIAGVAAAASRARQVGRQ